MDLHDETSEDRKIVEDYESIDLIVEDVFQNAVES